MKNILFFGVSQKSFFIDSTGAHKWRIPKLYTRCHLCYLHLQSGRRKRNDNQVLITKEEFVDIINRLRESSDLVDKVDTLQINKIENTEMIHCVIDNLQLGADNII